MQLVAKQQETLDKRTQEACARMPEYVRDWDGMPLPLGKNDTRDSLHRKIVKLTALVSHLFTCSSHYVTRIAVPSFSSYQCMCTWTY